MSWLLLLMQQKHECVVITTVCSDSLRHIPKSCVAELSVLPFIFLKTIQTDFHSPCDSFIPSNSV